MTESLQISNPQLIEQILLISGKTLTKAKDTIETKFVGMTVFVKVNLVEASLQVFAQERMVGQALLQINEESGFFWKFSSLVPKVFDRSETTFNHLLGLACVLSQMNTILSIENSEILVTANADFSFDQEKTIAGIINIFEIAEQVWTFLEEQEKLSKLPFEDAIDDLDIIYPINHHQFMVIH